MSQGSSPESPAPEHSPTPASYDETAPPPRESDAVLGRRAQLLATEHWGLLAARSTAQSEVLSRITIFLTLVSAGLVTIGLLGQASGFRGWFGGASLAILAFLALIRAAWIGVVAGLLLAAGFMTFGGVGFRWAWSHYVPRRLTPEDASPSLR